jgi:hypothetical protein
MAVTDYNTACGDLPQSFEQMLANLIVGYHDIAGVIHYRLNGTFSTAACTELEVAPTCDFSHLEEERVLVESIFGLDDCGRLTMKVFSNTSDCTDYSECAELPQSWIRMLARSVVIYAGTTKLNSIIDSVACTSLTQLLDCNVNNIEAERLLVTNVFGVDNCGNLLLKMVNDTSTMTDYHTECTELHQSFMQLLARCIVLYDGHYRLNIAAVTGYCDDLHDFWTCSNNHITPERALYENIFATDSCGNLAIKWYSNQAERKEQ